MDNGRFNLSKMKRAFLDALFPIHCLGCGEEGNWACSKCLSAVRIKPLYLCHGCARASPGGLTHLHCSRLTPLDALVSPYHYADPFTRRLIKEYKYRGAPEIGQVLGRLTSAGVRALLTQLPSRSAVVAMPLHVSRERLRGFNQTVVIAKAAAEVMGSPFVASLERIRRTSEQARLEIAEREKNCRAAFRSAPLSGEVILVDDVITSGATMRAAAQALKDAGAERVIGFALAHGQGDRLSR